MEPPPFLLYPSQLGEDLALPGGPALSPCATVQGLGQGIWGKPAPSGLKMMLSLALEDLFTDYQAAIQPLSSRGFLVPSP